MALALCAAGSPVRAGRVLTAPEIAPGSGIEMKVTSAYEEIPPLGYLPIRVAIKNRTNAPRGWNFESTCVQASTRNTRFVTGLQVEPETEKVFDLLVPLSAQIDGSRRYANLIISISGYGVTGDRNADLSTGGRSSSSTSFVGMGEALAVKNWGTIRENLEKKHTKSLEGTSLDLDFLPADWRGLAGFSILFFTDEEWRRIPAAQKGAIQDWVAQGGRLILVGTGGTSDLPPPGSVGCGTIEIWPKADEVAADGTKAQNFDDNFVQQAAKVLDEDDKSPLAKSLGSYNQSWAMAEKVGQSEPPQALILGFVIVFATIVGPVNFLLFAPAGRRHRLFWTTPLISLGASLLLGAFILLSEGFGGRGLRYEAVLSLPADHKEVLWQEQVSRTGILTRTAFETSEPNLMIPLSLRVIRLRGESSHSYLLKDTTWSGDWFRNRATQGQLMTTVVPTRGRLEIATDASGTPTAISSFEQPLEKCWYLDDEGKAWKAENMGPGEKKAMKSATTGEYIRDWNEALKEAGPVTVTAATEFTQGTPRGKFFATTAALPQPISSLKAIRWQKTGGLIYGLPAR